MLDEARDWLLKQLKAAKPSFISKTPHFNFISAHYFWIVGMTFLASVLIFATAGGQLAYIDALVLASGSNTQAGLNTVDINLLNTFQQICLYLFAMMSNPITIHSSVVFLRLYWFEKRFQGVVREARHRRGTLSKSKSKARQPNNNPNEVEKGVNGRNITVMHGSAKGSRITNDGILLGPTAEEDGRVSPGSNGIIPEYDLDIKDGNGAIKNGKTREQDQAPSAQIKFAGTVKRSDGLEPDLTKFPAPRSEAEHIAILERQRNGDGDEVLRIPNPRDAERGIKPKRLEEGDGPEAEDDIALAAESPDLEGSPGTPPTQTPNPRGRQQTIIIEEPERRMRDELAEEAVAIGHTFAPLKFRKPRLFSSKNKKYHVEDDDEDEIRPARTRSRTFEAIKGALAHREIEDTPYLSWTPTMGRNSQFLGLTLEQREELGGIEYRSLRTLALLLVCYFWGFSLFILACLLPWILSSANDKYGTIVENAGVTKTWWGFFTANSAFMDLGYTLTPDSMNSFQDVPFVLMIMWFIIIIGNTGFPVMLRVIIWILARIVPRGTGLWEELRFLLDHPRRCFTLLFPSGATWWLFWILIGLNILDLLFFVLLDLNDNAVSAFPVNIRIVDGLFQAASTRTAGFSCVNLALLHPAVQVSYMIMMYISVFPIAISIRRTNVYEEKSLGVYNTPDEEENANENSAMSYVGTHLRRQLSFDLWYVFVGLFVLAISEGGKIQDGKFDMFAVLFEIISAYGTVGMSLGFPGVNASLCSQFSVVGKLVIIAMMIRGRHRGLPYGLDRAILLPSESRFEKEAIEAQPVLVRSATAGTTATASGARRGSFNTGRGRSRSGERSNKNIITSFLHPGPVVPHHLHGLARDKSAEKNRNAGAGAGAGPADFVMRRRNTEPVDDDSEDEDPRMRARRVATTPMG